MNHHERANLNILQLSKLVGQAIPDSVILYNVTQYGGLIIDDSDCVLQDRGVLQTRLEPNGLFGFGAMTFDVDNVNISSIKPILEETAQAWAVFSTTSGVHLIFLENIWPNATVYASCYREDLLYLYQCLVERGIEPDPKHVWGPLLQGRSYVRLSPKVEGCQPLHSLQLVGIKESTISEEDYYEPWYIPLYINGRWYNIRQQAWRWLQEVCKLMSLPAPETLLPLI